MLWHLVSERCGIDRGETETNGSAPALGNFEHLDVDALVGQDDAIAEDERLAEALCSARNKFVLVQLNIWPVHVMKLHRRQVNLRGNQQSLWNRCSMLAFGGAL